MLVFLGITLILNVVNCQQPTQYNETEARMLVLLAAGAYADQNREAMSSCISAALPSDASSLLLVTMENCDDLNNPCECYIVSSHQLQRIFVVFRGTKTTSQLVLEGWSTLEGGVDFYGMGSVNTYFKKGHDLLWPSVQEILTNPQYSQYDVTFTGHSLGGALAALAAARTANEGIRQGENIRIVTFGEPRTGTAQFAQNYDSLIPYSFRVVFRADIVPHSPGCKKNKKVMALPNGSRECDPTALDKPYHHGTEIWYPDSMLPGSSYKECLGQPKNEDIECSDQLSFSLGKNDAYIWDHRHYFGVRVPEYGQSGCNPMYPEGVNNTKAQKYGYRR